MNLSLSWRSSQALKPHIDKIQIRTKKDGVNQEQTFALRIPLELDDSDLVHLKMEHLSWLR
jgi:hypothetical protein